MVEERWRGRKGNGAGAVGRHSRCSYRPNIESQFIERMINTGAASICAIPVIMGHEFWPAVLNTARAGTLNAACTTRPGDRSDLLHRRHRNRIDVRGERGGKAEICWAESTYGGKGGAWHLLRARGTWSRSLVGNENRARRSPSGGLGIWRRLNWGVRRDRSKRSGDLQRSSISKGVQTQGWASRVSLGELRSWSGGRTIACPKAGALAGVQQCINYGKRSH